MPTVVHDPSMYEKKDADEHRTPDIRCFRHGQAMIVDMGVEFLNCREQMDPEHYP